ncbi:mediator of RNA polymerase II transcription subunit 1-domain-containing protein [Aspergillus pseudonomiae]|uniref:Mediator of RNA polymerase II transcription subunit 1 n=1 Tax=Aspergillus pseudonomiae TaxID=1506151 RepID=A0A5N7DP46_9EURO|nr:mediator of RNA polymerase II transcription subunit 1-domain-containing protein [Aspergillus pseudonomiae]KAE8408186.1 mediator of RNA polymerase II transcription subunit 1-domain-containing protein [Aspergillus pseudonomiae]
MATPSSKQNPGATPTHLTSSPRPSGPMARPISHKSPSTRTPSASNHQLTSTHQNATPLAATAGADDPVTLSSPSALLALGGYGGISPSPAVHDALVAPGMHDSDIQALGMQGLKLGSARDSDEERRRHIEDVVQVLRTRVAGRGVCREGIERLGQLEGFESIWQEDSLSIAGNFVDLEIEFYRAQNTVKDVSLNIATPEATDGERREATAVLKRDLIESPEDRGRSSWKTLTKFHENLQWLAKHDRLSQEVNCFEAIEGLYESLKRIWDEEGDHRKFSGINDHLCSGWVGKPCLHQGGRIGLNLEYWVHQARVLDAKQKKASPDDMAIDQPSESSMDGESGNHNGKWNIIIECEEGYPSLRVSKEWVNSEVFTVMNNNTNEPSSSNEIGGSDVTVVNWADPPATLPSQDQQDAMALDSGMLGAAPNRRFVARMEPPLELPILAASDIYRHLGIQMPQEFKMVTYDGLLAPGWSPLSAAGAMGLGPEEASQLGRRRRKMAVQTVDQDGKPCTKQHSYTFQPFESVAGRTMRDIPFAHPRQLADILPTLRQYALLANMIRNIFSPPSKNDENRKDAQTDSSKNLVSQLKFTEPGKPKKDVIILSNNDPNEKKLDRLLKGFNNTDRTMKDKGKDTFKSNANGGDDNADEVKVDVTLRTQLGQAPVVMLLFTVNDPTDSAESAKEETTISKVSVSLEVGLNGRVSVVDMTGLLDHSSGLGDMDVQMTDEQKNEVSELQSKIARVLEISQDLGTLVEWILRWMQQRKGR